MDKLIFSLLLGLYTLATHAQEIIDPQNARQIVSVIKDIEVKDLLEKTSEFKTCRDQNKFEATDQEDTKTKKLQDAQTCFRKELEHSKDPKKLEKLSESLNLQHYGLVRSKNVKEIQSYLTDKMIESLTGVNPKEQSAKEYRENLKFGKKKIVDQKIFIDMYKTQLGKSALYEISRFCFENLRLEGVSGATFAEHWKDFEPGLTLNRAEANMVNVTDTGIPAFGKMQDPSDKEQIYKDIFTSIQGTGSAKTFNYENFFTDCGKLIVPLCDHFEKNLDPNSSQSQVSKNSLSKGSSACLTKARIRDYKKALANAEKVAEQFNKMEADDQKSLIVGLDKGAVNPKVFGTDPNDMSIDNLTNNTATDILNAGYSSDELIKKRAEECEEKPELSNCEGFISEDEGFDKAKHQLEMEMTLKREVEMARVRKLVSDGGKDLSQYLKDEGYFDVLEALKNNPNLKENEVANLIGKAFESKKIALLEQINSKLGKRQVKKGEALDETAVKEVVTETREEKARLAQVVLFNNIITSHLSLQKDLGNNKLEEAGRNINPWRKEEKALSAANVDPELFANLKASSEGVKELGSENQLNGFGILDDFLGKDPKDN